MQLSNHDSTTPPGVRKDGRTNAAIRIPLMPETDKRLRHAAVDAKRPIGELVAELVEKAYGTNTQKENQ